MQEELDRAGFSRLSPLLHMGPTSEDIDNIAWRLNIQEARDQVMLPALNQLINSIIRFTQDTQDHYMLGRTHTQPAGVTTFGKEMLVFVSRLKRQAAKLEAIQFEGKFNGIIGTYSGQRAAFPEKDIEWWIKFSDQFVSSFGLEPILLTSQNNPHDDIAEYLQTYQRINNIVRGMDDDIWLYILQKLLRQKATGDSGSSTGAAKVNPWRVEHAGPVASVANALADVIRQETTKYFLQRTLGDKTVMRWIGPAHSDTLNAWEYTKEQLSRLYADRSAMNESTYEDWSYLNEALQLILRRAGYADAYDMVKEMMQGKEFPELEWRNLIEQIISELELEANPENTSLIEALRSLSPEPFIEDAIRLTRIGLKEVERRN